MISGILKSVTKNFAMVDDVDVMNSKRKLIVSIFQLMIGILAIVAFVVAALSGESMLKWINIPPFAKKVFTRFVI